MPGSWRGSRGRTGGGRVVDRRPGGEAREGEAASWARGSFRHGGRRGKRRTQRVVGEGLGSTRRARWEEEGTKEESRDGRSGRRCRREGEERSLMESPTPKAKRLPGVSLLWPRNGKSAGLTPPAFGRRRSLPLAKRGSARGPRATYSQSPSSTNAPHVDGRASPLSFLFRSSIQSWACRSASSLPILRSHRFS